MHSDGPNFLDSQSIVSPQTICKEALLIFAAFFLPGTLGPRIGGEGFNSITYNLRLLIVAVPQVLLLLHILKVQRIADYPAFGFERPRAADPAYIAIVAVGLFCIGLLTSAGASLFPQSLREVLGAGIDWSFTNYAAVPLVAASSIAVGYREEIFFRSYILGRAEQIGLSPALRVLISTTLFAVGHAYQGLGGLLFSIIAGIFLAWFFLRRPSLHVVAIGHGLYNFAVLFLSGFIDS